MLPSDPNPAPYLFLAFAVICLILWCVKPKPGEV